MAIRFRATVTASWSTPRTNERRYLPNIKFEFSKERFGLATLYDFESSFLPGETKAARVKMLGIPDFASLIDGVEPGSKFVLYEGPREVAQGVVDEVEERTIDMP